MRFCRRAVWLSSSTSRRSESRDWRSSLRASVRSPAPSQMTPAQMTATIVLSAAISRIRQRIGSARSASRKAMVLRLPASMPVDRMACCKSVLSFSSHGFDPLDQGPKSWVGAHGVAQRLGRILERLAVDIADDTDARFDRQSLRALLPVQPLLAHILARLLGGFAENHAILGRQVGPGAQRHDQRFGAHGVLGRGVIAGHLVVVGRYE